MDKWRVDGVPGAPNSTVLMVSVIVIIVIMAIKWPKGGMFNRKSFPVLHTFAQRGSRVE